MFQPLGLRTGTRMIDVTTVTIGTCAPRPRDTRKRQGPGGMGASAGPWQSRPPGREEASVEAWPSSALL